MKMNLAFTWDEAKAQTNALKHKVTFKEASSVFLSGSNILTKFDDDHSEYEDRWISLGISSSGILLVVVHTHISDGNVIEIRIISSRRATKKETRQYNEQV
jgi:hypothetical protein